VVSGTLARANFTTGQPLAKWEVQIKYNQPYGVSDPNAAYINGNPSTGTMGSIPPAASIEFPQREIVNIISDGGFTPDNADLRQLGRSVQGGKLNYIIDTGTANQYSVNANPPLLAYTAGNHWLLKIGSTNTGPSTLNINGLGARAMVYGNGDQLSAGDLAAGGIVELYDDGTRLQVGATHTSHLAGPSGALTGVRMFTTPGTVVYTPTGGTRAVLVEVQGAGGAGGGAPVCNGPELAVGISGGGGGYARKYITAGFAGLSMTVGSRGLGQAGGYGGTGGTSSFGAIMSATGGTGGSPNGQIQASTPFSTAAVSGGSASGGDINVVGQPAFATMIYSTYSAIAGYAGGSLYGQSGMCFGVTTNGSDGLGYGAGGTAAMNFQQGVAYAGGNGTGGLIIIWEYA
jgi:hypothetical protein